MRPGLVLVLCMCPDRCLGLRCRRPRQRPVSKTSRKVSTSEDTAVQCSTRSCGADSEPPPRLARAAPIPAATVCHGAGDRACRQVYLVLPREIRLCRKIGPKRRSLADRREINRTGSVLSDYFCPLGLLISVASTRKEGPTASEETGTGARAQFHAHIACHCKTGLPLFNKSAQL